ncbi:hypothetical protein GF359_07385 [candidate division WOR-3 bacterium]|uniref:Uncharacterized protein n=1 Tax=candidate division WOR-3 bacterium TaxID=2052148 RepID=A0A9D5QDE4_UNCW3|nr:hypothetical protein [candidate division WOR-3 bacterium]MBD3365022.1 hypothetical protein [candidate division WOR-3 bacterium]
MRNIRKVIRGCMLFLVPCLMLGFEVTPEDVPFEGEVYHFPGGFYLSQEDTIRGYTDLEGEDVPSRYVVGFYRIEVVFMECTSDSTIDSTLTEDDMADIEGDAEVDSTEQKTAYELGGSGGFWPGSNVAYMGRFTDGFLFMREDAEPGDSILGRFFNMSDLKQFFDGEGGDSNTPRSEFRPIPLHHPQD